MKLLYLKIKAGHSRHHLTNFAEKNPFDTSNIWKESKRRDACSEKYNVLGENKIFAGLTIRIDEFVDNGRLFFWFSQLKTFEDQFNWTKCYFLSRQRVLFSSKVTWLFNKTGFRTLTGKRLTPTLVNTT